MMILIRQAAGRFYLNDGGQWFEVTKRTFDYVRIMSFSFKCIGNVSANGKTYNFFEALL